MAVAIAGWLLPRRQRLLLMLLRLRLRFPNLLAEQIFQPGAEEALLSQAVGLAGHLWVPAGDARRVAVRRAEAEWGGMAPLAEMEWHWVWLSQLFSFGMRELDAARTPRQ